MKKIFIIVFFIIFGSTFTFAENDKKITTEEIELILIGMNAERNYKRWTIEQKKSKTLANRLKYRKHLYGLCEGSDTAELCNARIIRRVFQRSAQGEVRRPGDIFYALSAIEDLIFAEKTRNKFVWTQYAFKARFALNDNISEKEDGKIFFTWSDASNPYNKYKGPLIEVKPEEKCVQWLTEYEDNQYLCSVYSDYTKKKLKKFTKDPSNEKLLGKPLVKHIKNVRIVNEIKEKIGTDNISLVGDMLNASVKNVVKNNVRPNLKKRRDLIKKYSTSLTKIKNKLEKNKFKSIEKDISSLSKIYKNLQSLNQTSHKLDIQIDEAIKILFETNKLIESSSLKAKDNEDDKLVALSAIYFMDSLLESILSVIPKNYRAINNKKLDPSLFDEEDIAELDSIINNIVNKNYIYRSAKMNLSINIIKKYIDASNIIEKLEKLGMKNLLNRSFTQSSAIQVAHEHIADNLDKELFKDVKKIVASVEKSGLNDLTKDLSKTVKEVSTSVKEITSSPSFKSNVTKSYPDPKFGGQSLKALIYMSRQR